MQPEPSKPVKALLRHRRRPQELSGTELQELDADGLQRGRSRELGGRAGHKTKDEDGESKEKGRGKEEDGDSDSTTDSEDFAGPASPGEETGELEDTGSSSGSRSSLPTPPRPPGLIPTLKHFWTHHINILIQDPTLQRDFLALERTYFAYFRTSSAFAQSSILLFQFFVLSAKIADTRPDAHSILPFHTFGRPVAVVVLCTGLGIQWVGTWRYFRWERAIRRGGAVTGGSWVAGVWAWSFGVVGVLFLVVCVAAA